MTRKRVKSTQLIVIEIYHTGGYGCELESKYNCIPLGVIRQLVPSVSASAI